MNDETEVLTKAELALHERVRHQACHYCDNENWYTLNRPGGTPLRLEVAGVTGLTVIGLVCTKCGNIRMHADTVLINDTLTARA